MSKQLMTGLVEVERGSWNGINRHSYRQYHFHNLLLTLDRTLNGNPKFFTLEAIEKDKLKGVGITLKVEGQEYWGDGITWIEAVKKMEFALAEKMGEIERARRNHITLRDGRLEQMLVTSN